MAALEYSQVKDFEKCVLGAVLLSNDVMDEVSRELEPNDFSSARHREVYQTMEAMYGEAKPIDLVTLTAELKRNGSMVGPSEVVMLSSVVPTTANVRYYIDQVALASRRRRLLQVARKAQNELEGGEDEVAVMDGMEQALVDIATGRVSHHYVPAHVALISAARRIDSVREGGDGVWAAEPGVPGFARILPYLEYEDYMVIGARPSVGKSAIALQMALDMSRRQRKKVAIFTLEMSGQALMTRALSQGLRLNSRKVRQGLIDAGEMKKIMDFGEELHDLKLFINDTPNMRLATLRAQARTIKQREGLDVLFIDYLTLVRGDSRMPRWEQVTAISAAMKELARELQIVVVALSQLGRDSENRRPTLASLRESGAIEQDADIVLLLHRVLEPDLDWTGEPQSQNVEFILGKNRNGPVGVVHMTFVPQHTRFELTEEYNEPNRH